MAFFLPSTFQKRLFRYALSQLTFLDMAAFDLDRLEGAWGSHSTGEIRDIPFKVDKLSELLSLPSWVKISKAKVLRLRLTVPLAIWRESIQVEIDGVEISCTISAEDQKEKGIQRGAKANQPRSTHPRKHDPGGDEHEGLPTVESLAQSFVQHAPEAEREEARTALAKQQGLEESQISTSSSGEDEGVAPAYTLPGMAADFLWQVGERLRITIKNIMFQVAFGLDLSSTGSAESSSESVTLRLTVESLDIQGIQATIRTQTQDAPSVLLGNHNITISNVQGFVVSEPSLFSTFSAMSVPPSPTTTHASIFRRETSSASAPSFPGSPSPDRRSVASKPASLSESQEIAMSRSTILDAPTDMFRSMYGGDLPPEHVEPTSEHDPLSESMVSSRYHGFESEAEISQFEDYSSPDQSFLENGRLEHTDSFPGSLAESDTLPMATFPHYSYRLHSPHTPTQLVPRSTSALSASSSSSSANLPPSQLLQALGGDSRIVGHSYPDVEASTTGESVFHDFSDNNSQHSEAQASQVFCDPQSQSALNATEEQPDTTEGLGNVTAEESDPFASESATPTPIANELMQSTLFTSEQAQSMYLSVIDGTQNEETSQVHIPGGWNSEYDPPLAFAGQLDVATTGNDESSDNTKGSKGTTETVPNNIDKADASDQAESGTLHYNDQSIRTEAQPEPSSTLRKRFFHIHTIKVEIPPALFRQVPPETPDIPHTAGPAPRQRRMPGEMSLYDSPHSRLERSTLRASITAARQESFGSDRDDDAPPPVIHIDKIELANDMGITKLAIMSVQQLLASIPVRETENVSNPPSPPSITPWRLRVDKFTWAMVDVLRGCMDDEVTPYPNGALTSTGVLLVTSVVDLTAAKRRKSDMSIIDIALGKYTFGYSDEAILSFDSTAKMRESMRDVPGSKDISVSIKMPPNGSPDVTIMTLPIHVVLDLRRLDETFSWFGGLNVMLGLGSSVMSATTVIDSKAAPKPTKVRFAAPGTEDLHEENIEPNSKAAKITARVGGLLFDLHGKDSSLCLEGTALKVVHRAEGIGMRIDKLRFTGPITHASPDQPAVSVNFGPLNVEFLQSPKEQDLARLIGLLSPSSLREEGEEDDILIDTLLRQRRKGSLLRLNIDQVKGEIRNLAQLEHFSLLADELKKLSTVAKYLPEDDRPGMMILSLIDNVDIGVEVNRQFGNAVLKSDNIELALVTMPYLLLLGVDCITAWHNKDKLLGEVLQQKKRERRGKLIDVNQQRTPMLLVKFIGNDLEPTFKVRFWNLIVEYHVTTVMAAMGIEETASGEVIVSEMVHSVANLANAPNPPKLSAQSSAISESLPAAKPTRVDVGLRDCVIALNPHRKPSRGLLVLTGAKVSAALPRNESSELEASVELKQSSFMVVNDIATLVVPEQSAVPGLTSPPMYGNTHKLALQKMGYVHTADISSARVTVKMSAKDTDGSRSMDVEVFDKLFVIESCADSTQTMAAVLGGLSPPMPPSTEIKYRTEIEPVEDMIASFTGDAFLADEDPASTYEYVEKSHAEGNFGIDSPTGSVGSDSSELAQKLGYDFPGHDPAAHLSSHPETRTGLRKIKLNFADNFYVHKETWDGKAYEWESTGKVYNRADPDKIRKSPLRLKVRDLHIIWNLFDGYDWQHTRDIIGDAVAEVERKAAERQARKAGRRPFEAEEEEDSVIGDFLFNSIYIGVGAKNDPRDLARQVNRNLADDVSESDSYATPTTVISATPSSRAVKTRRRRLRLDRSKHHKITFELKGVSADVVVFPPYSGETQNSIDLRIRDLEVFDHIHTSTWKKFATYMHDAGPREADMPMVHVELLNVKPIADLAASEIVMRLSVLPLRLHVDQDALDFITRFFEFKDTSAGPSQQPPTPGEQPFLQRVEVNAIPIKLDFKPKRVDYAGLRSGRTTEFMNFIVLESSDLVLERVIIYGISGFDRLGKTLNDIWTPEVKANQLPGVLAGLAPVRGIVNVGSGIKDLVVVPMREYRKDGRLVRAIQKGAVTFAKTTTTELAKLGARIALGTQSALQNAEGILVGASSPEDDIPGNIATTAGADDEVAQHISPYADQPLGVMAGMRGAWRHLERDILLAKDAIIAVPGEIREGGSAQGAAKALLRAAPTVILRPAIGVSRAAGTMLMGATNALDKQERRRTEDKYKRY